MIASFEPVSNSELLRATGVTVTLTLGGRADFSAVATSAAFADSSGTVTIFEFSTVGGASSCFTSASTWSNTALGADTISVRLLGCGVTTTCSSPRPRRLNIARNVPAASAASAFCM